MTDKHAKKLPSYSYCMSCHDNEGVMLVLCTVHTPSSKVLPLREIHLLHTAPLSCSIMLLFFYLRLRKNDPKDLEDFPYITTICNT